MERKTRMPGLLVYLLLCFLDTMPTLNPGCKRLSEGKRDQNISRRPFNHADSARYIEQAFGVDAQYGFLHYQI